MRFTLNTSPLKQNVMPLDPDFLASKPQTEMEWMLQYGEGPLDFRTGHIESVQEAVESLSDKSRQCIESIFYERSSYSKLASELGVSKPHAWRLTQRAMSELSVKLINNHNINERYKMFEHWEEASLAVLKVMEAQSPAKKGSAEYLLACQSRIAEKVRDYRGIPVDLVTSIGEHAVSHLKHSKMWDIEDMHDLLVSKQHDYGHTNIMMFGNTGIGIRICDKIARLSTLLDRGAKPQNESVFDTWCDIVGYSTIAQMLDNNTFTLELKGV
jgi:hypothetical protein